MQDPPPLPIIDITRTFVDMLARVLVKSYVSPVLRIFASAPSGDTQNVTRRMIDTTLPLPAPDSLFRRQNDIGYCTAESPCDDGSCCNSEGHCGFGPGNCGAGNCTANCESEQCALSC